MIVADLLADQSLQLRLHTPSSRSRLGRRISWCAPAEIADPTPYLSRNVLVLTTGTGMAAGDARMWQAYVGRLGSVPVAAIAFGTGPAHQVVPPGLARAATSLDVPLLEVPRSVSFLQVHRHVATVIEAEALDTRIRAWALAEACSRHVPAGASVRKMLGEVARAAGGAAALADGGGTVIARWPASSRWSEEDLRTARGDDGDERSVRLPMAGPDSFRLVVRGNPGGGSLPALLGPAASVMAVQLRTALETSSHKQSQLKTLLAQAPDWRGVTLREFTQTFRSTGLDTREPTLVVAAAPGEGRLSEVWKIRLALQEAFAELRMTRLDGLVFALAQRPTGSAGQDGKGRSLAETLARLLRSTVPDQAVVLKGPCDSVDELRLGLYQAAGLARKTAGPVAAPGLSIDALAAAAAGQGAHTEARKLLAPVLAYDRGHSAALLETLRTYLHNDCRSLQTCGMLFIHRNTLAQRLRKLESLLGLRLDTLEGQATCLMALRLHDRSTRTGRAASPGRE